MTRQALAVLVLAVFAAGTTAQDECTTDEPRLGRGGAVEWREDIEAAFADARANRRPILIYFTADW